MHGSCWAAGPEAAKRTCSGYGSDHDLSCLGRQSTGRSRGQGEKRGRAVQWRASRKKPSAPSCLDAVSPSRAGCPVVLVASGPPSSQVSKSECACCGCPVPCPSEASARKRHRQPPRSCSHFTRFTATAGRHLHVARKLGRPLPCFLLSPLVPSPPPNANAPRPSPVSLRAVFRSLSSSRLSTKQPACLAASASAHCSTAPLSSHHSNKQTDCCPFARPATHSPRSSRITLSHCRRRAASTLISCHRRRLVQRPPSRSLFLAPIRARVDHSLAPRPDHHTCLPLDRLAFASSLPLVPLPLASFHPELPS